MNSWNAGDARPSARVYGVAVRSGEVLLVRARSRMEGAEVWWLPGGGIDFLESPVEALSREIVEETGLTLISASLVDVVSDTWTRRNGETAHAIRIIYGIEVSSGGLRHEGDGSTDQARWVPISELEALELAPYARRAIATIA